MDSSPQYNFVLQNDRADTYTAHIWPKYNLVSLKFWRNIISLRLRSNHDILIIIFRAKTKREIIKELFDPSHYDPDTRPGEGIIIFNDICPFLALLLFCNPLTLPKSSSLSDENSGPTKIKVNLYVRDVQYVDVLKMEMGLQITFRYHKNCDSLIYGKSYFYRYHDL